MPERVPVFEPEVERLIAEIASDPDSYLLREPQRPGAIAPLDLEAGVSTRTAGLTVAEKHVLDAWRDEAAELLRQAFNASLAEDPIGEGQVIRLDRWNSDTATPTEAELRKREAVLSQVAHPRAGTALARGLEVMRDRGGVSGGLRGEFALLSYRICPTDEARICLAIAEGHHRRWSKALAMYYSILERTPAHDIRGHASCNAVTVLAELGNEKGRLAATEEALRQTPRWAHTLQKRFRTLADLGETAEASETLDRVQEQGPAVVQFLQDDLDWMVARVRAGKLKLTGGFVRVAAELALTRSDGIRESLARFAALK